MRRQTLLSPANLLWHGPGRCGGAADPGWRFATGDAAMAIETAQHQRAQLLEDNDKCWEALTTGEQAGARALGWDQAAWDDDSARGD